MAVVQVQNVCDPTNTQNVWVANFTGVGVDRSAFLTILGLVRDLNNRRPGGDVVRARRVFDTFGPDRASLAAAEFRRTTAAVDAKPAR